jgi:hypothetical protein
LYPEEGEPRDALSYLQSIYRNPAEDTSKRMRAAIESLPYENPKVSSVSVGYLDNSDTASRLDRAIDRINRTNGGKTLVVEATVIKEGVGD